MIIKWLKILWLQKGTHYPKYSAGFHSFIIQSALLQQKKYCARKVLKTSAQQPLQNIVAYNFFNSVSKLNITHQFSNTSLSTPKNQQILRSTASQTLEGSRWNTW